MKINVHDIEEVVKDLVYDEPTAALSKELQHGNVADFSFPDATHVEVHYHRGGDDLFFSGKIDSAVTGQCGRCLEDFDLPLSTDFSIVLAPRDEEAEDADLAADDLDMAFYGGEEVDLSPIVREQLILALPTRPLCREDCRGLCSECGANRNETECDCRPETGDPRMAIFRQMKVSR